jgi:phosphate transport system permease protein
MPELLNYVTGPKSGVHFRILTAVFLGCGRAIGETMAMVMVCGNIVQIPQTVFDPIRTLPANIALEMAYASGAHRSSLFLSGLVLTGLVMIMMAIAHQSYREKQYAA